MPVSQTGIYYHPRLILHCPSKTIEVLVVKITTSFCNLLVIKVIISFLKIQNQATFYSFYFIRDQWAVTLTAHMVINTRYTILYFRQILVAIFITLSNSVIFCAPTSDLPRAITKPRLMQRRAQIYTDTCSVAVCIWNCPLAFVCLRAYVLTLDVSTLVCLTSAI